MIIEKRQDIRKIKTNVATTKLMTNLHNSFYCEKRYAVENNSKVNDEYGYLGYPDFNSMDDDLRCDINPPIFVYSFALFIGVLAYSLGSYLFYG